MANIPSQSRLRRQRIGSISAWWWRTRANLPNRAASRVRADSIAISIFGATSGKLSVFVAADVSAEGFSVLAEGFAVFAGLLSFGKAWGWGDGVGHVAVEAWVGCTNVEGGSGVEKEEEGGG
ncbi:hypothetical protein ABW19_dt0209785 [Dactylella cylindrospora]|nr:hypothetical protein ABW19_dt0209785 [Dactylella cylindrospora]